MNPLNIKSLNPKKKHEKLKSYKIELINIIEVKLQLMNVYQQYVIICLLV
jgi:hypothetical protein